MGPPAPGGHMGCKGCALAYMGQGHQPLEAHAPKGQEEGRVLKGEGTSEVPWGGWTPPPLGRTLPWRKGQGCAFPSPLALYIVGEGRATIPKPWRLPLPPMTHLPPPAALGEALLESRYFHHHTIVLLDLHQPLLPPCWIKKEETLLLRTCVERGGAVRSALGSSVIWITTSTTPSTPFS